MKEPNIFGERVYKARKEMDLTQKEFAKLVGVTEETVRAWERGQQPRNKKCIRLCEVTGKSISFFYPKDEDTKDELSPKERALIEGFRAIPEPVQDAVVTIIDNCSSKGEQSRS